MITELQPGTARPELYEMIEFIDKAKTEEEMIERIRMFGSKYTAFNDYLRCIFDDRIQFLLPEGRPPYTPSNNGSYPSSWHKKNVELSLWVKGLKGENMNPIKRESRFIQMLESIHPDDALLISLITEKKTPIKKMTKEVVEKALPGLLN